MSMSNDLLLDEVEEPLFQATTYEVLGETQSESNPSVPGGGTTGGDVDLPPWFTP